MIARSLELSLSHDAAYKLAQQIFLRMRDRHQPRFCGVFEMVMTALDPYQIPTISFNVSNQLSAIHMTSMFGSAVVIITTS
ncbi:hypothetical protein BBI10_23910 [Pseudomonas graminis]|uniref:Uncharacterized protein n=1 Tax=Pseudomonas graminis TaxID=158627 RepID=A0A1C2D932_9PSED|nr:hypothetical protein BBI10_23910 [Pseudomonas graminis]